MFTLFLFSVCSLAISHCMKQLMLSWANVLNVYTVKRGVFFACIYFRLFSRKCSRDDLGQSLWRKWPPLVQRNCVTRFRGIDLSSISEIIVYGQRPVTNTCKFCKLLNLVGQIFVKNWASLVYFVSAHWISGGIPLDTIVLTAGTRKMEWLRFTQPLNIKASCCLKNML